MDAYRVDLHHFLLVHRENADGGRLAVQVENKFVRIRNVKVSILWRPLRAVSNIESMFVCFYPHLNWG